VAVLLAFSGAGGVEKMVLNLLPEFLAQGVAVDCLAIFRKPPAPDLAIPPGVRLIDQGVRNTSLCVPALVRYLRAERPDALLAAKDRAIRAAVLARILSGVPARLVGRLGTNLSAAYQGKSAIARWLRQAPMRWFYARVDHVAAVSQGVADDMRAIAGMVPEKLSVIRNPVITADMAARARAPVGHPWLNDGGAPVILGAGRLTRQKDFPTLLRAFAIVRAQRPARLIILGEGRMRGELERLAGELGIAEDVSMPGYVANPQAWMAKVACFALSSLWEGSPNVLTEALALGVPCASTDCPSGPREILGEGHYGSLTPVGDPARLAEAILETLNNPKAPDFLKQAAAEYRAELSASRYLEILGL
jgi:glycosyltransferase involved in cell wall biosynthesis